MKRRNPLGTFLCASGVVALLTAQPLIGAEPAPATQPTAAAALLDKIDASYAKLQSAQFDGHISGRFDVAGEKKNDDITFTSTFHAPNQFKHDAKGDVLLGSTGQTAYAFQPARNVYLSSDAPKDRADVTDWPQAITGILQQQNPSLLLALTKSAGGALKDLGDDMTRLPDTDVDGAALPTLQFELPQHEQVTMAIDPTSGLLRRVQFDLRKSLEERGAADVKAAQITIDYTLPKTDITTDDKTFAWAPPVGATLANAAPGALADDSSAATALAGTAAPDFTLSGLDDKPVKLSSLKGSVVVLDFWATWCGPCVMSLPHIDQLHKDQSPHGLKVFAVNLQEDKDTVKTFIDQKKFSLPVLLDTNGDTAKLYKADAIPETVIIGKDGVIKKVFVGVTDDSEEQIKSIVAKEMGG